MEIAKRVTVEKAIKLRDGEELQGFIKQAIAAIGRVSGVDGKANESLFLNGIFETFLVAKDFENGKFMRFPFTRDTEGVINLGKGVEVKQVFVPVSQETNKSGDSQPDIGVETLLEVAKSAEVETEEHDIEVDHGWGGVLAGAGG